MYKTQFYNSIKMCIIYIICIMYYILYSLLYNELLNIESKNIVTTVVQTCTNRRKQSH